MAAIAIQFKGFEDMKKEYEGQLKGLIKAREGKWTKLSSGKFRGCNGEPKCVLCDMVYAGCEGCVLTLATGVDFCNDDEEGLYFQWYAKMAEVRLGLCSNSPDTSHEQDTRTSINSPEVVALAKKIKKVMIKSEKTLRKLIKALN